MKLGLILDPSYDYRTLQVCCCVMGDTLYCYNESSSRGCYAMSQLLKAKDLESLFI